MKRRTLFPLIPAAVLLAIPLSANAAPARPLRALMVAGGCCHDYATQTKLLKEGIEERINASVEVIYNPDTSTEARFDIYESDGWARDFDVVIHDECSANVSERPYVDRILNEAEACHKAHPKNHVKLIGFDNYAQSKGAEMVVYRGKAV